MAIHYKYTITSRSSSKSKTQAFKQQAKGHLSYTTTND
jgi:hypothetical protein